MSYSGRSDSPYQQQQRLSRRQLLALAGAGIMLSACDEGPTGNVGATPSVVARTHNLTDLMSTSPFYIAHRGSGDNWPEHTAIAYARSLQSGAKAIEVSVSATNDGILVCHHDVNTQRMTGRNLHIGEVSYNELASLRNDSRAWLGPSTGLEPLPRVKDVLDAHASNCVIFIEDKQGSNTSALLDLMDAYPDAKEHFVWKQTAGGKHYAAAKERGYKTWGYFVDGTDNKFSSFADRFDYLGIYHGASDDEIKALVAIEKPVICWEIHTRWMRERVLALGVKGLMASNFPYVSGNAAINDRDTFSSGVRAAGDLPWILGPSYQPTIQAELSSVSLNNEAGASYVMGSMCPVAQDKYSLCFDMRWPLTLPDESGSAGIAFGQSDDQPYRPLAPATVAGYHLALDRSGALRLFSRQIGQADGKLLAEVDSRPPSAGDWMRFRVDIDPTGIAFTRTDGPTVTGRANDTTHRGGYFGLTKNYKGKWPVEFRNVQVL